MAAARPPASPPSSPPPPPSPPPSLPPVAARESGFAGLARDVGPECNGRCARMRTEWHRAAPERLLPGRARPGGHPRPHRCRLQRWWSVSATVIAVT